MATTDQIVQLRANIAEPLDADPWSHRALEQLLEQYGSVAAASAAVWRTKAAAVADLVDVSEAGASRSMSKLYAQYLEMARTFDGTITVVGATSSAPRTRGITRA